MDSHPHFRALLFDVANTLLGKPSFYPSLQRVLHEQAGWSGPISVLEHLHRVTSEVSEVPPRPERAFYDEFNSRWLQALGLRPSNNLLKAIYQSARQAAWRPFPDCEALQTLRLPIGVLSNWDASLPNVLHELFPKTHFDFVLASESLGYAKPDPRAFAASLQHWELPPGQILFVGDSPRLDFFPAEAAGLQPVLLDRSDFYPHFIGHRVRSLWEIAAWQPAV